MSQAATNSYFKPWVIALRVFGINYVDDSFTSCPKIQKIRQKCIVSFTYGCILFAMSSTISNLINRKINLENISETAAGWGYHVTLFLSYSVLQSKRQSLHIFLNKLSHLAQELSPQKRKQLLILKVVSVLTPLTISISSFRDMKEWRDWRDPVGEFLYGFFINPLNMFLTFLSVFICFILNSIFDQFKLEIENELDKKMDHSSWCRLVKRFIVRHKKLSQFVSEFGNIYSYIYLIYFVFYIALIIFSMRAINFNRSIENWNLRYILAVFQVAGLFLMQVFSVQSVNSQVLSSAYLMRPQLLISTYIYEETKLTTILANSELSLYIQQVCANPAALTAGNFFVINNGVIISAGATILTYILVLYSNDCNC